MPISRSVEVARPVDVCGMLASGDCPPLGELSERSTASLRPHAQYLQLWGPVAAVRTARVSQQTGPIVEPLVTTVDGTILDGHARWQAAKERQQPTLPCLVYDVSEAQAVEIVIERHRATGGLNAFARVLLALPLELHLREKTAVSAEMAIGGEKNSSTLTKRKPRDVRQDLARIAGVSTGNVTKVKQVLDGVTPEIQQRLIRGEVSIHRAWQWRKLSKQDQRAALWSHLHRRSIKTTVRQLVGKHTKSQSGAPVDIASAIIRDLAASDLTDITVAVVDVPGRAVVVTRRLYEEIRRRADAAR